VDLTILLDDFNGLTEFRALLVPAEYHASKVAELAAALLDWLDPDFVQALTDYGAAEAIAEAEAVAGIVWGEPLGVPA